MSKLDEHLESYLDFDDCAKDIKQFTNALCSLKLDGLFLFWKTRFNVLNESFGGSLVESRVIEERCLDVSDKLALGDSCVSLGLGQLEEELKAGHLIILLQLKEDQKSLVLNISILGSGQFLLKLID